MGYVEYPTRKIYMLSHLEPSSAITGGPWYTDNELDTEFIKQLMDACLGFIRKMVSFLALMSPSFFDSDTYIVGLTYSIYAIPTLN